MKGFQIRFPKAVPCTNCLAQQDLGLAWNPFSGELWTSVNERDELGDNLVPDYMTSVKRGGFYGWPYSYYGRNTDDRVKPQRPDLVAHATRPDYALGAHTASLGLAFYSGSLFPARYQGGAFIGQPEKFLTGFLDNKGNARGRPAGIVIDKAGALLVADDVGNTIWRVAPSMKPSKP